MLIRKLMMIFLKWLNDKYGEHGDVSATRGNTHDYLGMTFEFGSGEVHANMINYVKGMLEESPKKFKKSDTAVNPASIDMCCSKSDVLPPLVEESDDGCTTKFGQEVALEGQNSIHTRSEGIAEEESDPAYYHRHQQGECDNVIKMTYAQVTSSGLKK